MSMRLTRPIAIAVVGLVASTVGGCRSVRGDEALAMLEISATAEVPSFTTARFSVAGRPEISPREVRYDGSAPLKFGYYLPGPNGTLRISVQALSASCLVGTGSAEVDVQLGHVSTAVALIIKPLVEPDPVCGAAGDASLDGDVPDASSDLTTDTMDGDAIASDASDVPPTDGPPATTDGPPATTDGPPATTDGPPATTDGPPATTDGPPATTDGPPATTDAMVDMMSTPPPPPACMVATKACPGASACCSGLVCGTTTLGRVCCGNYNMTCNRAGGEDCCGQLECVSGHCCLPATYACSDASCCPGLVCGTTSLGRVCCGNRGAPCKRADGADCCGALECVKGVCG